MENLQGKTDDELQREYEELDRRISERTEQYTRFLRQLREASVLLDENRKDRSDQRLIFSEINRRRRDKCWQRIQDEKKSK